MTYPISPEPYRYYAKCQGQVIAVYYHYNKLINDVKSFYRDLVKNHGVIIVDNNNITLTTLTHNEHR